MVENPLYIVFYGTLKAGTERFREIGLEKYLNYMCECEITGDLYDIETGKENYPALVDGSGIVKAQLFEIKDPSFLPVSDKYEEIDLKHPENSLYVRKSLHLRKPDVDAWCYVYNQSVEGCQKIDSGNWSTYLAQKRAANSKFPQHKLRTKSDLFAKAV